jgi:hypothetical protein
VSLDELVTTLPGVYPTEVRAAIVRLMARGVMSSSMLERATPQLAVREQQPSARSLLPTPHPLDYDWRFTDRTVGTLLEEAERRGAVGGVIALLGAPRVFEVVANTLDQECVLLDANAAVVANLSDARRRNHEGQVAIVCDLARSPLPRLDARVVIADPPWYPRYLRVFLWAAAALCAVGGYLLVSVPAEGTRPGVIKEYGRVLGWARALGWQPASWEPKVLRYISPPFERNALRVQGIPDLPVDWRCSDLVVLRKATPGSGLARPRGHVDSPWREVRIGRVRLRFREQRPVENGYRDPRLHRIVEGDVLDSVSRRDPRRRMADVWSCCNRVYGCDGVALLHVVAQAVASGRDVIEEGASWLGRPPTTGEADAVCEAAEQIASLVEVEEDEIESI